MNDFFLKLMFNILKLHDLHNDLPFLSEKLKKVKKLVANLHDIQIRNLKKALNHGLVLKKVQFNQNALIKPNIDLNTNLKKCEK